MVENFDQRIREIIAEQLMADLEEVTDKAEFVDDLGADSLDVAELILAFEDEFGIEISDNEAEKIQTVGEAIKLITQKIPYKICFLLLWLEIEQNYKLV